MLNNLIVLFIMTFLGALGAFCFKKAISKAETILKVVYSPILYVGGILYVLGATLNIIVLKKLPYTIVLPLTSITYIWTLTISHFILKEKITKHKITGVLLIIIGAALISMKI